jgi:hypothetical protein
MAMWITKRTTTKAAVAGMDLDPRIIKTAKYDPNQSQEAIVFILCSLLV